MSKKGPYIELSHEQLDALIERVEQAAAEGMALSREDLNLLLNALRMLADLQSKLSDTDVTLHKLRKLAGIVASSEKLLNTGSSTAKKSKRPLKKPAKPRQKPPAQQRSHHRIEGLEKGDLCPDCEKGKLAKTEPALRLRISGHSPLVATEHVLERLRCSLCGAYFTAALPEAVLNDGAPQQRYGYSARAIMAIQRYFVGTPFYRQQSLQQLLGVSVTASTVFDQCESLANDIKPVHDALIRLAAEQAGVFYVDDTPHRILNQQPIQRPDRRSGKLTERSGVYTSAVVAIVPGLAPIILYKTTIGHAGEWLDEILPYRPPGTAPPILMGDAATRNRPSVIDQYHRVLCNAHARRQFVDVHSKDPPLYDWVLERYAQLWINDEKAQTLSAEQRLQYHQTHSLPVFEQIRQRGLDLLASDEIEPNSAPGQAWQYFLNHFESLSACCRIIAAPVDNNRCERALKWVIRGRNNSLFFKTLAGAAVADTICSLLACAEQASINVFDYLVALQRHADAVRLNPQAWIPTKFLAQIDSIEKSHIPA